MAAGIGLRRRFSELAYALALVLALLAVDARVRAQADDARAAFTAGEAAFAEDDYVTALEHFRRAYALAPHVAVRFNIAVCLERLGRFREAALEYGAAAEDSTLSEDGRIEALALAARVRERLGVIRVEPHEGTSTVVIDDDVRCPLPCEVALDPGRHQVAGMSSDGTVVAEASVEAVRGEVAIARLAPIASADAPIERVDDGGMRRDDVALPSSPGPSALTPIAASILAIGVGGVIGFGLHAEGLHARYVAGPSQALLDEGVLMRDLANVSIGVLSLGAVLLLVDTLIWGTAVRASSDSAWTDPALRF